ncbi:type II toxin-antitoxin system RelE/ParE family toxin [Arthrobacter sp. AQ5-05]|uniref:type II toxin-antitoxin system RelE/ParE family toxin n=1 Tax=Arthrobacter sp. AQ5-05 TaxID=2184581 RepID=UPI00336AE8B8
MQLEEDRGPQPGRPVVDGATHSRHENMKELRPGSSGGSGLRVLFAFDPKRQAIISIAGDKAGNRDHRYKKNIPVADDLFDGHLRSLKGK